MGTLHPRSAGIALLLALVACDRGGALYDRARELAVEGKHREALAQAVRAADELERGDPRRLKALVLAGDLAYLFVGDLHAAVAHYQRLCDEAPEAEETFVARGRLGDLYRERLRDLPAAIEQYQALLAAFPRRPEALGYRSLLARSCLELKDYEQARNEARVLFQQAPDGALADDALFLVATAYQAEGRKGEALGAFRDMAARFPRSPLAPLAWVEAGNLLADAGDDDGALAAYQNAEAAHRDPAVVRELVDRVRRRVERRKKAPEAALAP